MGLKETGRAEDWVEIDRFDAGEAGAGVGWIARPGESMRRASHALVSDEEVWVIDPVDAPGIDELLAEFGEVAGVVVLLGRHTRDADAFARRHDVPVYVSDLLSGVAGELSSPVERYHRDLADTGYAAHEVIDRIGWREVALYGEATGTLVLADSLGTAEYFLVGDEQVGVHPALRFRPPRELARLQPNRVLVGHGQGILEGATPALEYALDGARARLPRLYWQNFWAFVDG